MNLHSFFYGKSINMTFFPIKKPSMKVMKVMKVQINIDRKNDVPMFLRSSVPNYQRTQEHVFLRPTFYEPSYFIPS
jgi:hypothetical protein